MRLVALTLGTVAAASAGTLLWDGRFNDLTSSADLEKWSWSNSVGPYQYYIHGKSPASRYISLSPAYKNQADSKSKAGAKISLDASSVWNSDMWRTELIPEPKSTNGPINKNKVFYHFSLKRGEQNAPSKSHEHQVAFFESHFTELKYGALSGEAAESGELRWMVQGKTLWKTTWRAEKWENFAYEIDFDAKTVGLWHSSGGEPLRQTVPPVKANTNSDGKDWHVGVLRLPKPGKDSAAKEDWYFSGVYIESGPVTTSVSGP